MQVLEFVTCWAALWSHFCPASCWHSAVILQCRETHIPQTWRVPLFVLKVITPAKDPATKEQCTSVVCKVATLARSLCKRDFYLRIQVNVKKMNKFYWWGKSTATTSRSDNNTDNEIQTEWWCFRCWDNSTYNLGWCWEYQPSTSFCFLTNRVFIYTLSSW